MDEISNKELKKLEQFARKCMRVRSYFYLGTRSLTATNYAQEKEKFFSSKNYNPHFKYNHEKLHGLDREIDKLREELENIDIPHDFRLYLEHYLNDTENCEKAVRAIGTEEFPSVAENIFNLNSPKIQKYLNLSPEVTIIEEEKTKLHTAEEIAEIFRQVLKEKYNIEHYEVKIDHFNDHTVRVGAKKVILGEKIKRFRKSIDRLIVHEIESHVLQRINIEKSPILTLTPLGERTLYGEGLAVFNEVTNEKITLKMYKLYSLRLKAVRLLDRSFREIYEELTGGVPNNIAYQITYRVKRGLHDTSLPGGYPKDAFYLLGYMVVDDYVKNKGKVEDLYLARTPEMLEFVSKYNIPTTESLTLPHFLRQDHE